MKNVNYQPTIDATPARVGMVTLDHKIVNGDLALALDVTTNTTLVKI